MFYSPTQLRVLLVLASVFLAGLAVREWRAGFPELADRLERVDQGEPEVPAPLVATRSARVERPAPPPAVPRAEPRSDPAPAVPPDPRPLDLNRATLAELARLPGMGPGLAQRVVEERQRRGRFDSPEALRHVVGLGPKKLAALRDLVTVEATRE